MYGQSSLSFLFFLSNLLNITFKSSSLSINSSISAFLSHLTFLDFDSSLSLSMLLFSTFSPPLTKSNEFCIISLDAAPDGRIKTHLPTLTANTLRLSFGFHLILLMPSNESSSMCLCLISKSLVFVLTCDDLDCPFILKFHFLKHLPLETSHSRNSPSSEPESSHWPQGLGASARTGA
eukprot:NODE_4_length_55019_cov_0.425091.p31 type:complete len:178 gc:universal NODE_4_length_55019_cov_0.425091:13135-13668(+)